MSTDLTRLLPSAPAPLTGNDSCYLPQNASPRSRLRWPAQLSSGFVFAEAASRGVRYDKYFAIGKFSRHIFSPGYCRSMRAGNNLALLLIFFLHFSPQWCFSISQQVFGRRSPVARSCPVAASCLMVLLSSTCLLEQPE